MRVHVHAVGAAAVLAPVLAVATGCGGSSSGGSPAAAAGGQQQSQAASQPVQHPKSLVGEVGEHDKFAIEVHDENDKPITNLAAGTYTLKVEDYSSIHDFHLTGPGVDDATDIGGKGTKTFSVTFTPGTYTFMCDPHASSMHGEFRVS